MKKTIGKVARVSGKVAKHTLLIQPIRVLIILNSILLPILIGFLIFIILKYAQEIEGIIDKAKKIEKMVRENIKLGIEKIKQGIAAAEAAGGTALDFASNHIKPDNIKQFIKDTLLEPLILYINPAKVFAQNELDELKNAIGFSKVKINEIKTLLELSSHSVNEFINSNIDQLKKAGCTMKQIKKVLKENRDIVYILTHSALNN